MSSPLSAPRSFNEGKWGGKSLSRIRTAERSGFSAENAAKPSYSYRQWYFYKRTTTAHSYMKRHNGMDWFFIITTNWVAAAKVRNKIINNALSRPVKLTRQQIIRTRCQKIRFKKFNKKKGTVTEKSTIHKTVKQMVDITNTTIANNK